MSRGESALLLVNFKHTEISPVSAKELNHLNGLSSGLGGLLFSETVPVGFLRLLITHGYQIISSRGFDGNGAPLFFYIYQCCHAQVSGIRYTIYNRHPRPYIYHLATSKQLWNKVIYCLRFSDFSTYKY